MGNKANGHQRQCKVSPARPSSSKVLQGELVRCEVPHKAGNAAQNDLLRSLLTGSWHMSGSCKRRKCLPQAPTTILSGDPPGGVVLWVGPALLPSRRVEPTHILQLPLLHSSSNSSRNNNSLVPHQIHRPPPNKKENNTHTHRLDIRRVVRAEAMQLSRSVVVGCHSTVL